MSVEISVFAGLLVTAAFLSVVVKSLLYAVFFQIQAVMAVAGILAGLNAPLSGFALVSMSAASLAAFLIFALIVFDGADGEKRVPPAAGKTSVLFLVLTGIQVVALFFKTGRTADVAAADSAFFDEVQYGRYGLCAAVIGTVLLSGLIGLATLTATEEKTK